MFQGDINLSADVVITISAATIIIAIIRAFWKNRKKIKNYSGKMRDKRVNKVIKQAMRLIENDFKALITRELRGSTYQKGLSIVQELNERIERDIKVLNEKEAEDKDANI